jgi:phosphopantothenoylcysteine synthetase/decarboxylase
MHNPSLRQEPRYEPAPVIPVNKDSSIIEWLEKNGRLTKREKEERELILEDELELSEFMDTDDTYDVDIDDDDDDEIVINEDA